MEIKKGNKIRLSPLGYRRICQMVDESAGGSDTLENLILLCENCHEIYAHGDNERKYRVLFTDCRMDVGRMKAWNEAHKGEAERIYRRFKK